MTNYKRKFMKSPQGILKELEREFDMVWLKAVIEEKVKTTLHSTCTPQYWDWLLGLCMGNVPVSLCWLHEVNSGLVHFLPGMEKVLWYNPEWECEMLFVFSTVHKNSYVWTFSPPSRKGGLLRGPLFTWFFLLLITGTKGPTNFHLLVHESCSFISSKEISYYLLHFIFLSWKTFEAVKIYKSSCVCTLHHLLSFSLSVHYKYTHTDNMHI